MTKAEIASYLTSLLTLIEAQDTSGVHNRSAVLAAEYNKHWDMLKETIQKENDDEARRSDKLKVGIDKAGHDDTRDLARSSEPDRRGSGLPRTAVDYGQGSPGPGDA